FFQAEDGIRDRNVTGVQTCALPILLLSLIFIAWGGAAPKNLDKVSSAAQAFLQEHFGWFYLISASIILIFAIYLAFSKYGDIKLGKDDDEPEYSRFSWFAMLFS